MPSFSTNAACTGESLSGVPSSLDRHNRHTATASIASTEHPKDAAFVVEHDRTHARRRYGITEPALGPVIAGSSRSRSAESSVVRGCTVTSRFVPLIASVILTSPAIGLLSAAGSVVSSAAGALAGQARLSQHDTRQRTSWPHRGNQGLVNPGLLDSSIVCGGGEIVSSGMIAS